MQTAILLSTLFFLLFPVDHINKQIKMSEYPTLKEFSLKGKVAVVTGGAR